MTRSRAVPVFVCRVDPVYENGNCSSRMFAKAVLSHRAAVDSGASATAVLPPADFEFPGVYLGSVRRTARTGLPSNPTNLSGNAINS